MAIARPPHLTPDCQARAYASNRSSRRLSMKSAPTPSRTIPTPTAPTTMSLPPVVGRRLPPAGTTGSGVWLALAEPVGGAVALALLDALAVAVADALAGLLLELEADALALELDEAGRQASEYEVPANVTDETTVATVPGGLLV